MPTRKLPHKYTREPYPLLKSKNLPQNIQGNILKYLSYREAWSRIKQAQQQEFFLEAVTLEESIITDRLICYLVVTGTIKPALELHKYPNFGQLIKIWKLLHNNPISIRVRAIEFEDLQSSVDLWRQQRNKIVHGMVKSHPGTATDDILNFLESAKLTATEGEMLARAVSAWVKKASQQERKRHQQQSV